MASSSERSASDRLVWLDIARVLSAVMILAFHWLRPGYRLGLFGSFQSDHELPVEQRRSAAVSRPVHRGFEPHPQHVVDQHHRHPGRLRLGGGERVHFASAAFRSSCVPTRKTSDVAGWIAWYCQPCGAHPHPVLLGRASVPHGCSSRHGRFSLRTRLSGTHAGDQARIAISYLAARRRSEPHHSAGSIRVAMIPNFFVPAWWFIPAILLAYVTYPLVRRGQSNRARPAAPRGIGTHHDDGLHLVRRVRIEKRIVVLHRYAGVVQLQPGRRRRQSLAQRRTVGTRTRDQQPWSLCRSFCRVRAWQPLQLERRWAPSCEHAFRAEPGTHAGVGGEATRDVAAREQDARDRSLRFVSRAPTFAYPIALAAKMFFGGYAVFVGWFVFLTVASIAARILTLVQRPFHAVPPLPNMPTRVAGQSALRRTTLVD